MCNFCRIYDTLVLVFGDFRYWHATTNEGKAAVKAIQKLTEQEPRSDGVVFPLELSEFAISDALIADGITIPVFKELCALSVSFPIGQVINSLDLLLTAPGSIPRFLVYVWVRNEMSTFGKNFRGYAVC